MFFSYNYDSRMNDLSEIMKVTDMAIQRSALQCFIKNEIYILNHLKSGPVKRSQALDRAMSHYERMGFSFEKGDIGCRYRKFEA